MTVEGEIADTVAVNTVGWAYVFSSAKWEAYVDSPANVVSLIVAGVVVLYTVLRIIHLVTHWRRNRRNK